MVDGHLAANARWANDAWVRVQQLEAEVSELKGRVDSSPDDRKHAGLYGEHAQADEIEAQRRAAEIVKAAEARAAELAEASQCDRQEAEELVERAEADMAEAGRRAGEIVKVAEARAAELVADPQGEHDKSSRYEMSPHRDVERFLDQVEERMRQPGRGSPAESEQPPH